MHISKLYPKIKDNIDIKGITSNSKNVKKDYIFVAIKGKKYNGAKFIKEALFLGAAYIVTSSFTFGKNIIHVKNPKAEYIKLLQTFYYYNQTIYTVGVTGTDGKTTTATILSRIFEEGRQTAYIGTNGIKYQDRKYNSINTTPDPGTLYQAYNIFNNRNIKAIVMEVSSEGVKDDRIKGFNFDGAIFTNLSHEHLNTHRTMNEYFKCKAKLFEAVDKNGIILANQDDEYYYHIRSHTDAKIISYGLNNGTYRATDVLITPNGSEFTLTYKGKKLYRFKTKLFGTYNVYNTLASIAYSYELGLPLDVISNAILKIDKIDGRFEQYEFNKRLAIIDFAHTPNALYNLLSNIKRFAKKRIILILGCQGLKDDSKRPLMGMVASKLADIVIFTSEDPKTESIFNIFLSLTKNITDTDYYLTLSRYEGIKLAHDISKENDIIVITGKGNETIEKVYNYSFHHNDLNTLKSIVNNDIAKNDIRN